MNVQVEEPPSKYRNKIQLPCAGRLPNRLTSSDNSRSMSSKGCQLVYICLSPGCKPWLGYHNSLGLYQDDEVNHERK